MKYLNIESLLVKYEQGTCSDEELKQVETFLGEQDKIEIDAYKNFVSSEKEIKYHVDVLGLINEETSDLNIEQELIESESLLKNEQYSAFINQEKSIQSDLNVDELLHDYDVVPENIDQLLAEQEKSMGSLYNKFIEQEAQKNLTTNISKFLNNEKSETKVVPLRKAGTWKRLTAIAAIFVFALAAIFVLRQNVSQSNPVLAEVNGVEITDPEEALAYTLSILNKTSVNMQKGTDNMKVLTQLEHTQIYK